MTQHIHQRYRDIENVILVICKRTKPFSKRDIMNETCDTYYTMCDIFDHLLQLNKIESLGTGLFQFKPFTI